MHVCIHTHAALVFSRVLAAWVDRECHASCNGLDWSLCQHVCITLPCPGDHSHLLVVLVDVLDLASSKHNIPDLLHTTSCLGLWPV